MARRPNLLVIWSDDTGTTDGSPFDRPDGLPHTR